MLSLHNLLMLLCLVKKLKDYRVNKMIVKANEIEKRLLYFKSLYTP